MFSLEQMPKEISKWPRRNGLSARKRQRPMSKDLGLLPMTPQAGHCARAASQAVLKELLGKGLARGWGEGAPSPSRASLWLCCVGRPSLGGKKGSHPFLGIGLPPRLARDPSALPPFRKFLLAFALRNLREGEAPAEPKNSSLSNHAVTMIVPPAPVDLALSRNAG